MNSILTTCLLMTALIAPSFAAGQTNGINPELILEHLYEAGSAPQWQSSRQTANQSPEALSQQAAAVLAGDVLERLTLDADISPTEQGRLLSNAGVFQTYAGDLVAGRTTLDQALETLLKDRHQFDPEIATVVTAIGVNAFLQEDFETAENQFRWSQHIQHREDGLYAATQAKNLNWLTRVYLAELNFDAADTAQRYILRIARNTYREGSPELTKVKDGIAKYLAQRGKMISPLSDELQRATRQTLFADAIGLLNENLRSTEATFGPETVDLVSTLETQAEIFYWRGNHNRQQERALERALSILQMQPNQSPARLAAAWFNLADGYVLTGNRKAIDAYSAAWSLTTAAQLPQHSSPVTPIAPPSPLGLTQVPEPPSKEDPLKTVAEAEAVADAMPNPGRAQLQPDAVTPAPPILLWPEAFAALAFEPVNAERYPPDIDYFVDFSFTISEMGKPKGIRITDRNVPSEEARWARSAIHNSRYRPALLDGMAVPFESSYRQRFQRQVHPDDIPLADNSERGLIDPSSSQSPTQPSPSGGAPP